MYLDAPEVEAGIGGMLTGGGGDDGGGNPAIALAGIIALFMALKFFLERFTNISFSEPRISIVGALIQLPQTIIGIILFKTAVAALEGRGINTGGLKAIAGAL